MTRVKTVMLSVAAVLFVTGVTSVWAQAPASRSAADISQRLARIEKLLQSQGLLDMLQRLDNMQQQLKELRGELEVQGRDIEELKRRQHSLYTDLDRRLQRIEGTTTTTNLSSLDNSPDATGNPPLQTLSPVSGSSDQVNAPSAGNPLNIQVLSAEPAPQQQTESAPQQQPEAGVGTNNSQPATAQAQTAQAQTAQATDTTADQGSQSPATGEANADPAARQAEYQQAFNLLKQAHYEQAIKALRAFLKKYPTGDYSDNAQYWLGEAFYVMRQFEPALAEYKKVIANFPQSPKYTHALLKIGYCYYELGHLDEAKQTLQSLVNQYPGETASRLAEERLKSIALTEQQTGAAGN